MTDIVKVAIITAVPGTIAAVMGVFNRAKLGDVGRRVDGRLSELLEETRKASKAEGVKEGENAADAH
jgi:hypothetical protein